MGLIEQSRVPREVLLFGIFGGLQLVIDWLVFVLLTAAGLAAAPANVLGRVTGSTAGYWLNASITFDARPRSTKHGFVQIARYLAGWGLTTGLSTVAIHMIASQYGLHAAWIGKLFVDGCLAVLGFLLSKFWIYR